MPYKLHGLNRDKLRFVRTDVYLMHEAEKLAVAAEFVFVSVTRKR